MAFPLANEKTIVYFNCIPIKECGKGKYGVT